MKIPLFVFNNEASQTSMKGNYYIFRNYFKKIALRYLIYFVKENYQSKFNNILSNKFLKVITML